MNVLGDLVARDRRSSAVALRVPALDRDYSYHDFCTTSWKAGNFLAFLGVRADHRVAIEPDPLPEPLFTFFGAALQGATTTFTPTDAGVRAVVVPRSRESEFADVPGTKRVVYGGPPSDPTVARWEKAVWSENPAFPPTEVDPDATALVVPVDADSSLGTVDTAENNAYSHRTLLAAAESVADEAGLTAAAEVVVRGSVSDPGVAVAGVLAPLLVGATVVSPMTADADADSDADTTEGRGGSQGTIAVTEGDAPEARVVSPEGLLDGI